MYTWANLNHTLCDADNDPVFAYFNLGESYYFWAELYLGAVSFAGAYFNYFFISLLVPIVGLV
jgi:hypothetical protein